MVECKNPFLSIFKVMQYEKYRLCEYCLLDRPAQTTQVFVLNK